MGWNATLQKESIQSYLLNLRTLRSARTEISILWTLRASEIWIIQELRPEPIKWKTKILFEFIAYLTERFLLLLCIKLMRKSTMPSDTERDIVWILWLERRRGSWESKQSGCPKGAPVWRTQKFTARRELDSKKLNAAPRDGLAVGGSSEKLDITRFVVTGMRASWMNINSLKIQSSRETQPTKMETPSYRRGRRLHGFRREEEELINWRRGMRELANNSNLCRFLSLRLRHLFLSSVAKVHFFLNQAMHRMWQFGSVYTCYGSFYFPNQLYCGGGCAAPTLINCALQLPHTSRLQTIAVKFYIIPSFNATKVENYEDTKVLNNVSSN